MHTVVEHALARLIIQLGVLRVGIIGEDSRKPCFVRVPSMDLDDFIEWKSIKTSDQAEHDEEVLQSIKNRLEQLWPDVANRPPWKLLVVQDLSSSPEEIVLDIIFATHHALADGKSTAVFHNQLLYELNNAKGPPPQLKKHILTFSDSPVIAPSQEDLVPLTISWPYLIKTLWKELGPAWLKPKPSAAPWTGKAVSPEPQSLHLRLVSIEREIVDRLIVACREHRTTLSGIVHALVLASIARRVPAATASSFASETPISLLPWARLPPDAPAIDLSAVLTVLTTGSKRQWDAKTVWTLRSSLSNYPDEPGAEDVGDKEDIIWRLAKDWRDEIKAKLATLPRDDIVGLLAYAGDLRARWLGKIGKPRDATWEVSNIGSMRGEGRAGADAWSIRRSLFSQPVPTASVAFCVNVAGVDGGPVNLVLNWQDTIIDNSVVTGVAEDLRAWTKEFGRSSRFGIVKGSV